MSRDRGMANSEHAAMQWMQLSGSDGTSHRALRIAEFGELARRDDSVLGTCQLRQCMMRSYFPSHTGDKGDRRPDSPPASVDVALLAA